MILKFIIPTILLQLCWTLAASVPSQNNPVKICPENEQYNTCGNNCTDSCKNHFQIQRCTRNCYPGCFCDDGFLRNSAGLCVPEGKCCPENEDFFDCGNNCMNSCGFLLGQRSCTKECYSGCFCMDGYYRNEDGMCIAEDQCCPDNEEFLECGNNCTNSCDFYLGDQRCTRNCYSGCFCEYGFFRNSYGVCVPQEECCPENEEYDTCGNSCTEACYYGLQMCTDKCDKGCFCKDGFSRNPAGYCVPEDECDDIEETCLCGEYEEFDNCGNYCSETCETFLGHLYCTNECQKGCFCKNGYYRNSQRLCVPEEQCCPGENEEFQTCGNNCTDTCLTYLGLQYCLSDVCYPGCFCQDGFYRNSEGLCIQEDQCCPDNEEYVCGNYCAETCEGYFGQETCTYDCYPDCFCIEGYSRNSEGICVPHEECCPYVCGENEKCDTCGNSCTESCKSFLGFQDCTDDCQVGCFCEDGYYRNYAGLCIPQDQCCTNEEGYACGENEEYKCSNNCTESCEYYFGLEYCTEDCQVGCYCQEGFYRNSAGTCVQQDQCCFGKNEQHSDCGDFCSETCDAHLGLLPCIRDCYPGCFCDAGYYRNSEGVCVPEDECCPENEEFYICESDCTIECQASCVCKEGFSRNSNGVCVPDFEYCPEHEEYYTCGNTCADSCKYYLGDQVCTRECHSGCFCEEGYYRNFLGICIPKYHCCHDNEEFRDCDHYCKETYNDVLGVGDCALNCYSGCVCTDGYTRNVEGLCVPNCYGENEEYNDYKNDCTDSCMYYLGLEDCTFNSYSSCYCIEGYSRNLEGLCIPQCDCRAHIEDYLCGENEEYQNCENYCRDSNSYGLCIKTCGSGCVCKEGYVRNSEGLCVPDCCANNEEFLVCGNHCRDTCDALLHPGIFCSLNCQEGCFCKEGYYRNSEDECVPKEDCCSVEEQYLKCGNRCLESCDNSRNGRKFCPAVCDEGCFCGNGYSRNSQGVCVRKRFCQTETLPRLGPTY